MKNQSESARLVTVERGYRLNASTLNPFEGMTHLARVRGGSVGGAHLNAQSSNCSLWRLAHFESERVWFGRGGGPESQIFEPVPKPHADPEG